MKTRLIAPIALALAGLLACANAAIITVNTADNTDFSVGKTNLWLAMLNRMSVESAQLGDSTGVLQGLGG